MVAASGNDFVNRVTYPARDERVIAVGATTDNRLPGRLLEHRHAASTSWRRAAATTPLSTTTRLGPRRTATLPSLAAGIVQETLFGSTSKLRAVGFEGTSFAAPHVSAAAGLVVATLRARRGKPSPDGRAAAATGHGA